jgi:hypothetical protein
VVLQIFGFLIVFWVEFQSFVYGFFLFFCFLLIMAYGFPCYSYFVDLLYFDIGLRTFSLTYMRTCEYNRANPFAYSESQISQNYGPVCLPVLETVFCFQNSETCFGTID